MGICIPGLTVFILKQGFGVPLQWRHNEYNSVSNDWLPISGLCAGNSPVTGEFPAQKASCTENVIMLPVLPAMYLHGNRMELTWKKQAKT